MIWYSCSGYHLNTEEQESANTVKAEKQNVKKTAGKSPAVHM